MPINNLTEEGFGILTGSGVSGFDPDAQAFITAAGITGATQQAALNQLVLDLKGEGSTTNNTDVWSDLIIMYPMCPIDGSTATRDAYKWNLKDPRDLDAAYRITWANNPTASVNGITGNATSQYGDTHLALNTPSAENLCFSVVINNPSTAAVSDYFGAFNAVSYGHFLFFINSSSTLGLLSNSSGTVSFGGDVNVTGNQVLFQRVVAGQSAYLNGSLVDSDLTSAKAQTADNPNLLLLAEGRTSEATRFNDGTINCFHYSTQLTTNKIKDLSDSVLKFNTSLGR